MASLDSLPADQRAVLQLVLQRGRTYDDIAALLSIDRTAVRQRALAALDALGPQTSIPAEQRALITDYLLGQLPERVSDTTRDRLARSPSERAWARVLASELSEIATTPLPEIPVAGGKAEPAAAEEPEPDRGSETSAPSEPPPPPEPARAAASRVRRARRDDKSEMPQGDGTAPKSELDHVRASSRRGGALLLGVAAIVVVAVVIILVTNGGGSGNNSTTAAGTTPASSTPATAPTTGTTTTPTTGTSTTTPTTPIGQVNLKAPTAGSKTVGIAEVLRQGTTIGIAIVARNVPPNTKSDAYAVWLYNSPSDAQRLGFVSPGVTSSGRLSTAGALPSNAAHFKQLIVTRETQATPKQPGTIILQGGPLPAL